MVESVQLSRRGSKIKVVGRWDIYSKRRDHIALELRRNSGENRKKSMMYGHVYWVRRGSMEGREGEAG